jgi:hypothetical protein
MSWGTEKREKPIIKEVHCLKSTDDHVTGELVNLMDSATVKRTVENKQTGIDRVSRHANLFEAWTVSRRHAGRRNSQCAHVTITALMAGSSILWAQMVDGTSRSSSMVIMFSLPAKSALAAGGIRASRLVVNAKSNRASVHGFVA